MKKALREAAYKKFGCKCAYCGCELAFKDMQVDHIHPRIAGGKEDLDNLNPACRVCNNWKLHHSLEMFRRELESQIERLNLRSSNYRIAKKYDLIRDTDKKVIFYFERFL